MFKIVKSDEQITINTVTILIYGEPGAGKTSLANTANNPLTLDFDKGIHRSDFRKDVLVIDNWKEINDNSSQLFDTFKMYDTIILDTIDTLLDYMGTWIIDREPKLAKNKLQFYGKLKDEFSLFIGRLKTLGKDVVMVAHVKEKDEGDLRIKRPAITGGSYDRVLQTADFVGYSHYNDNKRTLDFNPTDYWIGKNSAKFGSLIIPDFNIVNDYFATLISQMKESINGQTQSQMETIKLINEFKAKIDNVNDLDSINELFSDLSKRNLKNGVKKQIWNAVIERATQLNFIFNKENNVFIDIETYEPSEKDLKPIKTTK